MAGKMGLLQNGEYQSRFELVLFVTNWYWCSMRCELQAVPELV